VPREYVGQAEVVTRDDEGRVRLRVSVANWAGAQAVQRAYDRGQYRGRFPDYVRDQERALQGRPEDHRWLLEQLARLRRHAAGALVTG
jgi:hypothetical protein